MKEAANPVLDKSYPDAAAEESGLEIVSRLWRLILGLRLKKEKDFYLYGNCGSKSPEVNIRRIQRNRSRAGGCRGHYRRGCVENELKEGSRTKTQTARYGRRQTGPGRRSDF